MRPFRILTIIFSLYSFVISCSKSTKCPTVQTVTINQNGPVVAGWPLRLEADVQNGKYIYKWSGPNGWSKQYDRYTSGAYVQDFEGVFPVDAGEYKLQLLNTDGCVEYDGSTLVNVTSTPLCNTAANTSTSSIVGLGNFNFSTRTFIAGNGHYVMTGAETVPGDYMAIVFPSIALPQLSIYETGAQMGTEAGKVGLFISVGGSTYLANPGQPVFVTRVNNKIEIAFCSVQFENLNPANPLIISAKIVEP